MGRAGPGAARARTKGAGAGQESCRVKERPGEPAVLRGATGAGGAADHAFGSGLATGAEA